MRIDAGWVDRPADRIAARRWLAEQRPVSCAGADRSDVTVLGTGDAHRCPVWARRPDIGVCPASRGPIMSASLSPRYPQPRTYPVAHLPREPIERQVVVVGAGPVGLAVALGLARRGVQVSLLEAADSVSHGSRAICVSRHSLEVLDRLGIWDAVRQRSLPWTDGRSFYGTHEVLSFRMSAAAHDVRPPMVNISQGVAEQLMVDRAATTSGVELLWGVRVTDVHPAADGVMLTLQTVDGVRTLKAGWVVAADGARSDVRRLLGLSLRGASYEGRYVIADIHLPADLPAERRVWFDPPSAAGSTIIMHRQPDNIWRVDYQLRPDEDADRELAADRIRERITRHLSWLGIDTAWTLEWSSIYRAHALSLDEYVHGRVAFAGDAAHLVPIFGVRGLNSGLEDADTLAWQLAAVVHGAAEPALLTAYSAERRQAWEQNVASAVKSTRIMSPERLGDELTRDALLALAVREPAFRPLIDPRQSAATHARRSPLTWRGLHGGDGVMPGDPLTDQAVDVMTHSGLQRSTLFAEFGTGFALVGIDVDERELTPIRDRAAGALSPEPVRAVVVATAAEAAPGAVRLCDHGLVLGQSGDILVVRPDGLVLCRVPEAERDRLHDLGRALGRGAAPAAGADREGERAPSQSSLERAWTSLSDVLDEVADPRGFLTRLSLALARHVGEDAWDAAVQLSRSGRPDEIP